MAILRTLKSNSNSGKSAVSVPVIRDTDRTLDQILSKTNWRFVFLSRIASRWLIILIKWRDDESCVCGMITQAHPNSSEENPAIGTN